MMEVLAVVRQCGFVVSNIQHAHTKIKKQQRMTVVGHGGNGVFAQAGLQGHTMGGLMVGWYSKFYQQHAYIFQGTGITGDLRARQPWLFGYTGIAITK